MKIGIIDIGSNSVRLAIIENGKTLRKLVRTSQLAEGLATNGVLLEQPMLETMQAIVKLKNTAKSQGVDNIYAYATESFRSAINGKDFADRVKLETNINIEILNGDDEAKIGFYGAYKKGNCCVVDIGGASTEIVIGNEKNISYQKSLPIGSVRLRDLCGENKDNVTAYVKAFLSGYGKINEKYDEVIAIGGTPTTIVSIIEKMKEYNPAKVHNYKLTKKAVMDCYDFVSAYPLAERHKIDGLPEQRANVILGGMILLICAMDKLKVDFVCVSEDDNLEGYYQCFIKNSNNESLNKCLC